MTEDEVIATEASRIESDALYTAQTNFDQAVFYGRLTVWLGLPATITAALAGAAVVASWSDVIAGAFAVAATSLSGANLFIGAERRASEHHGQGVAYRQLQHDARRLRTLAPFSTSTERRRSELEALVRRAADLNRANRPSERAFKNAQKKIGSGDVTQPGDEGLV